MTKSADFGQSACKARPQGLRDRFSAFPAVRMTRAQHTNRGEQQKSTLQALTSAITGPAQPLNQVLQSIHMILNQLPCSGHCKPPEAFGMDPAVPPERYERALDFCRSWRADLTV